MYVISTAAVPAEERFAFWREATAKLWVPYDLSCEAQPESRFQARVRIGDFGPVQATLITTTPHVVRRTPKLIRQADPEVFKLGLLLHGGGVMAQGGRRADLRAGDLTLFDTSRPFDAAHDPGIAVSGLLLLQFPRPLLALPPGDVRRLSAVRIPGDRGIGALSSHFLTQLARHMEEFGPAESARLATLTLDVLAAALADALDAHSVLPPHTRQRALMAQVRAFIQQNLGDPRLTPGAIAAAHHISVRYLHKLFHAEGHTVAGWVRARRLEQCRRDLADPRLAARPVSAVAARWGFGSAARFSQAFRAAYGISPSRYRQQCAQGKDEGAPR